MNEALKKLPADAREALHTSRQPAWTAPMLATLTDERFSRDDWIFERKFDGERCLAFIKNGKAALKSRNNKVINKTYPELAEELKRHAGNDCIIDGEIVAFEGKRTSFSRLQGRMQLKDPAEARQSDIAVYYYLFDILHFDGYDLTDLPLKHRKSILKRALNFKDHLRFTEHRAKHGERYYEHACSRGWEGLIAKDANAHYVHKRSRNWLKFKCAKGQELVIGGFTDPQGSRVGFGALLVGYYEGGKLRYAGKVGTGYDDETLRDLRKRMNRLERKTCPFVNGDDIREKRVHWIKPALVGEFGFTEWTEDGKLRHPRFKGLRDDKKPAAVRREKT